MYTQTTKKMAPVMYRYEVISNIRRNLHNSTLHFTQKFKKK